MREVLSEAWHGELVIGTACSVKRILWSAYSLYYSMSPAPTAVTLLTDTVMAPRNEGATLYYPKRSPAPSQPAPSLAAPSPISSVLPFCSVLSFLKGGSCAACSDASRERLPGRGAH